MRSKLLAAAAMSVVALTATLATAATVDVAVDSQSGPWLTSVNPTLDYGDHSESGPTSVSAGFDFTAGGVFTITWLSGLTSAYGGVDPYSDGDGDTGFDASDSLGNSGNVFPSFYIDHSQYPAYLNALIGAFADAGGHVVGTPFLVGNGPYDATAPGGATQLLLGLNDDIFGDNSGAFLVRVSGPGAVPEPATWTMMIAGFGLAGGALRRRRFAVV
jgi:hypothetical protein